MGKASPRLWLLIVMVGGGLATTGLSASAAQRPFSMSPRRQTFATAARPSFGKPTIGDTISSSIKEGLGKLSDVLKPKPRVKPADDPISVFNKAKPRVETHVAVARLYAETGKPTKAAEHYQRALRQAPNNLAALLGYAHLKDRLGEPAEASRLYLQAIKAHPNEAAVHNNLGLFCASRGMLGESASTFTRAIQLQPNNPKYRNNFARLLVRMGRTSEALVQLRAAHRDAVAYYNLGYLLEEQGQKQAAAEQFALALRADPSLAPARRGLQRLQFSSAPPQPPGHPGNSGTRVGRRPAPPPVRRDIQNAPPTAGHTPLGAPFAPLPSMGYDSAPPNGRRPTPRQFTPAPTPWHQRTQSGTTPPADSQPNEAAPLPPSGSTLMRLPPAHSAGQNHVPPIGAPRQAVAPEPPPPPNSYRRQPTSAPLLPPLPPRANTGTVLQHLPPVD